MQNLCLLVLLNLHSCSQQLPGNKSAQRLFTFEDEQFHQMDDRTMKELENGLLGLNVLGVILSGPARVDLQQHEGLPLLVGIRYTGEMEWEFPISDNCSLEITDLKTKKMTTLKLFKETKRPDRDEGQGDKPQEGLAGAAAVVFTIDIREVMEIPWVESEWEFKVIYQEWKSNEVRLRITSSHF